MKSYHCLVCRGSDVKTRETQETCTDCMGSGFSLEGARSFQGGGVGSVVVEPRLGRFGSHVFGVACGCYRRLVSGADSMGDLT